MKKITILMLLVSALAVHAQSSVGGYIGFGRSAFSFEDFTIDPDAQAGYVPIGVQITLGDGMLQFGAEASYSAVPFKFEYEESGRKVGDISVTQLFLGGFLRINIGNEAIQPYVKAGGGAYMGKLKWEPEKAFEAMAPEDEMDFKTAFGFYGSVGIDIKLGKTLAIFGEIPFHIVSRKLDIEGVDDDDIDPITANNYALIAGVRILFK